MTFGKRILILAPHPDDEMVMACASMARAQAEGAEIFVLFLTHGCIAKETLFPWQRQFHDTQVALRRTEAEEASLFMGIKIIGFSDRPTRHLWQELPQVRTEIQTALDAYDIDQLWIPAYEGGHSDHDGLNGLCQSFKDKVSILEFAEYNYAHGKANAHNFPAFHGTETTLLLTEQERQNKALALMLYESERKNLGHIGLTQECYRPLASYDYRSPPHEGTLWYTRFHWVPFAHPRIDFTKPRAVSEAIQKSGIGGQGSGEEKSIYSLCQIK